MDPDASKRHSPISTAQMIRYYHLVVQPGWTDFQQRAPKTRKKFWKRKKFWRGVAGTVIAGLIVWAVTVGLPSLFRSPPSTSSPGTSSQSNSTGSRHTSSQGTSTTNPPSRSAPEFLVGLPVASGDMPQKGLVTIGGQSFSKSLYYDNSTRVQTSYSTVFNLTGHWRKFVAWVGIQPDPADIMGSCTRDAGSTYQVLVDQNRVAQGVVTCEPQKVSVSVAGAHELDLVFDTHPFYIATGEFAWANAKLQ